MEVKQPTWQHFSALRHSFIHFTSLVTRCRFVSLLLFALNSFRWQYCANMWWGCVSTSMMYLASSRVDALQGQARSGLGPTVTAVKSIVTSASPSERWLSHCSCQVVTRRRADVYLLQLASQQWMNQLQLCEACQLYMRSLPDLPPNRL